MSFVSRPGRLARSFIASIASFAANLDHDAVVVVDGLPLDRPAAERGKRISRFDVEVQPAWIPPAGLSHLRGSRCDFVVASRIDVERVEILRRATVEVAERQSSSTDDPDTCDLVRGAQLRDERPEPVEDVLSAESRRHA